MIGHQNVITWISVFCLSLVVNTAQADRVKDLTNVGGVRGNQLVGYGLVVGILSGLLREMAFYGWPNWIGDSITVAASALWFVLPWLGVVWLLINIWESKPRWS